MKIFSIICFERLVPFGLVVITFLAIAYWRADVTGIFGQTSVKPDNLYSAVFNWSSIQSGFVF